MRAIVSTKRWTQASIYNENGQIDITARRNEIAQRMKVDKVAEYIWKARMEG